MDPQPNDNSAGMHTAFGDVANATGEESWRDHVVQDHELVPDMLGDFRGWFSLGSPH